MTTSSAIWAYGSLLQIGDAAASENFTTVAEITELTPPAMSRDDIDVSNNSSSDGYREFIPGWRDGGEVSAKANWLPTNTTQDYTTGLHAQFNDNVKHNYKIILPSTLITISFSGFLTAFEPDLPLEEQAQLSFTIKISGKPTVA
jgi:predicted secreted protein